MSEEKNDIEEIQKQIALERLRQAPLTVKISFGSRGEFMNRDQLIEQIENNTELGKKIVKIQMEYLKAFRKKISAS
jgi:hypothetical protein